jgi:hypothetical protein
MLTAEMISIDENRESLIEFLSFGKLPYNLGHVRTPNLYQSFDPNALQHRPSHNRQNLRTFTSILVFSGRSSGDFVIEFGPPINLSLSPASPRDLHPNNGTETNTK